MGTETKVLTENQVKGIKIEKRPHASVPPYRSDGQTVRASARVVWEQSRPPAHRAGNACAHTRLPSTGPWPPAPHDACSSSVHGHSVHESGDTPPTAGKRSSTRGPWGTALRSDAGPSWRSDLRTQEQDPASCERSRRSGTGAGRSPGRDGANVLGRKSRVHRSGLWDAPPLSRRQRGRARVGLGRAQGPGTEARGLG